MPKVVDETTSEVKPKRAPRKRVASLSETRKRVTKKSPTNEIDSEVLATESIAVAASKRKAPTRLKEMVEESSGPKKSFRNLYVVGALIVTVFGAAAIIGYSDAGQIDISSVVSERNARVAAGNINPETDGESPSSIVVPVQNSQSQVVDGGLERSTEPPVLERANVDITSASSSATSTEAENIDETNQTSTSTETTNEEGTETEASVEESEPTTESPSI